MTDAAFGAGRGKKPARAVKGGKLEFSGRFRRVGARDEAPRMVSGRAARPMAPAPAATTRRCQAAVIFGGAALRPERARRILFTEIATVALDSARRLP